MPYYTTHAITANSCALHVFEHPRQDYEQLTKILRVHTEAIGMNVRCYM